ncbi:MAG: hypothetical protein EOO26_10175 [Comamonadaceae bacterium]|nr:MAG: hypothetical protein EOO26_10175 [Comamonadaceae bacterium]
MHVHPLIAIPPTAETVPPRSVEQLWLLLLEQVQHRSTPTGGAVAGRALHLNLETGYQLQDLWPAEAQALFDLFKPLLDLQSRNGEWAIAQLGQSLDGCVATRTGDSHFINGPDNIQHLHRLRALSDAVLIGAGSVAADNPQLTTRKVPGPNPVRVVLDPRLGLEAQVSTAQVFVDRLAPTLWLCDARWGDRAKALVGDERTLAVDGLLRDDGTPDLALAVAALRARGLKRLFVEGGGVTVSRFVAQGCLDRLHLAVAPLIIGNGRPGLSFEGAARLADCQRPAHKVHAMGVDQLWDLQLRA